MCKTRLSCQFIPSEQAIQPANTAGLPRLAKARPQKALLRLRIMKSAACFVGLVLVAFAAVTAADGNPSTWLRDYLEPPSQAKSLSGHYEPVSFGLLLMPEHATCNGWSGDTPSSKRGSVS